MVSWKRRLLGDPEHVGRRVFGGVLAVCVAICAVGLWWSLTHDLEPSRSSLPLLEPVLRVATSTWAYLVPVAVLLRSWLFFRRDRKAQKAAERTGYAPNTVKHLAAAVRRPVGATRTVIQTGDSREDAAEFVDAALDGDEEELTANVDAHDADPDADAYTGATPSNRDNLPSISDSVSDSSSDTVSDEWEWRAKMRQKRLDVLSMVRADDVAWHAVVPAVVVMVSALVIARIWVAWWLYPVMLAASVFVGVANYLRVRRKHEKRVRAHEQDTRTGEQWDEVSVLAKTVETDALTIHVARMNGKTYAHHDREAFAEGVGERAWELVTPGETLSPSIMRKFARNLMQMQPDLPGYVSNVERKQIIERLIQGVRQSPEGIVPKQQLVEDTVEDDGDDLGRDPELVRECYRAITPGLLVEHDIDLDASGTVTAVGVRDNPLPPDASAIQAEFSAKFSRFAEFEPLYEMPETSIDDVPEWCRDSINPHLKSYS